MYFLIKIPVAFFQNPDKVSEYFVAWAWSDVACLEICVRGQVHPCQPRHHRESLQLLVGMEENKTQRASTVGAVALAKMLPRVVDPPCSGWSQMNAVEKAPTPAHFRTCGIILVEATATFAVCRHLAAEMCKTEPGCSYWLRQGVRRLPHPRSCRSRRGRRIGWLISDHLRYC